jgi:hypothetical protein
MYNTGKHRLVIDSDYDSDSEKPKKKPKGKEVRDIVFTINNPTEEDLELLDELENDDNTQYLVYQGEKGANGTQHIQGFVQLKKKRLILAFKKKFLPRGFTDARKGTPSQAAAYCKKDESYDITVCKRVESGSLQERKSGQRSEFQSLTEALKSGAKYLDLVNNFTGSCIRYRNNIINVAQDLQANKSRAGHRLIVLFGDSGSGKSYRAKEILGGAAQEGVQWSECNPTLSNYRDANAPRKILLEEFKGNILLSDFKRLFDSGAARPTLGQRYRDVTYLSELTVITSNYHPARWYDLTDPESGDTNALAIYRRIDECYHVTGFYNAGTQHIESLECGLHYLPDWFQNARLPVKPKM